MHILDLIMFFVLAGILWWIMDKTSDGELTNELIDFGVGIEVYFAAFYIAIFVVLDNNWVDIASWISALHIDIKW
jgi:hypothetical protein